MAADALVSLGVVLAALVISVTGWMWLDPIVSLVIVVVIAWGTWGLLRESLDLAMDAVPDRIDPHKVEAYLAGLPGVVAVHDLHIWGISTTEAALTVHLVKPDVVIDDALIERINNNARKIRHRPHDCAVRVGRCKAPLWTSTRRSTLTGSVTHAPKLFSQFEMG